MFDLPKVSALKSLFPGSFSATPVLVGDTAKSS